MRLFLSLLVLLAAGGGVWWWAHQTDEVDNDVDYVFDVETEQVVPRARMQGLEQTGVVPLGVVGKVPRPREPLGSQDRWMTAPIRLPAVPVVSGRQLLEAMSRNAPIRFRDQGELDAFGAGEIEDLPTAQGEQIEGHIFEDLCGHLGFKMEVKEHFIFVYNPDNNDAFRKRLLASRKQNKKK